jgi:hypothetical protein
MQAWTDMRLGLMAVGYHRILHVELSCIDCGDWRGQLREEQEFYSCPGCGKASKLRFACEGFSRSPDFPGWRLIEPSLKRSLQRLMKTMSCDERLRIKRPRRLRNSARLPSRGF